MLCPEIVSQCFAYIYEIRSHSYIFFITKMCCTRHNFTPCPRKLGRIVLHIDMKIRATQFRFWMRSNFHDTIAFSRMLSSTMHKKSLERPDSTNATPRSTDNMMSPRSDSQDSLLNNKSCLKTWKIYWTFEAFCWLFSDVSTETEV